MFSGVSAALIKAAELVQGGWSIRESANKKNLLYNTVRSYCKNNGIESQHSTGQKQKRVPKAKG
jgi:hypothetical protein